MTFYNCAAPVLKHSSFSQLVQFCQKWHDEQMMRGVLNSIWYFV